MGRRASPRLFVVSFAWIALAAAGFDRLVAWTTADVVTQDPVTTHAFMVAGDPQYRAEDAELPAALDPSSEDSNARFIALLRTIAGREIPAALGGGAVSDAIAGLLVCGDLIDSADKNARNFPAMQRFEWRRFLADYGLVGGDGRQPYPVYELHGNHDGPMGDTFIIRDIIERNRRRPGVVRTSENGLHYSWDVGPLHIVNLGIIVGEGEAPREGHHYAARSSLEFLREDLPAEVGASGRPVAVAFHLHPWCEEYDWPAEDLAGFWEAMLPYQVVAIFHGHTHGSPPSRQRWDGTTFGPDLETGIDVFNPDDAGAVGDLHGFLYVELVDRAGDRADELVVRSLATRDSWATWTWDRVWRVPVTIPE